MKKSEVKKLQPKKEEASMSVVPISQDIIQSLVLDGDISKMNPQQKVEYYNRFCQSLGLNPLTQPFQIIKFQGKEKLYATKDCTEQLRKLHNVSISELTSQELRGVFVVTAKAVDSAGKTDAATGAVNIDGLKGEGLANALMKAETKAKRRVTLSICGLGILDESELETMPSHETKAVLTETNPLQLSQPKAEPKASLLTKLTPAGYEKLKEKIKAEGLTVLNAALKSIELSKEQQEELADIYQSMSTANQISSEEKQKMEHAFLACNSPQDLEMVAKSYDEYAGNPTYNELYSKTKIRVVKS